MALGVSVCARCVARPWPFDRVLAAVDYVPPWRDLIHRFKFGGEVGLAGTLAQALVETVARAEGPHPDLVIPMPSSPERLRERGFNPAWELGRRVARAMRMPAKAQCLQRVVHAAPLAGMNRRQRGAQLRGAFQVPREARALLRGRRIALVDDVCTTGSSVYAAFVALQAAGVGACELWVLARTPPPDEGQDGMEPGD